MTWYSHPSAATLGRTALVPTTPSPSRKRKAMRPLKDDAKGASAMILDYAQEGGSKAGYLPRPAW
jgi:hypothetical protein